jgi:hypothetical protein
LADFQPFLGVDKILEAQKQKAGATATACGLFAWNHKRARDQPYDNRGTLRVRSVFMGHPVVGLSVGELRGGGLDGEGDGGRVEERVVDEAVVDGLLHAFALLGGEVDGYGDSDVEVGYARGVRNLVGSDVDAGARCGDALLLEVSDGVERGA